MEMTLMGIYNNTSANDSIKKRLISTLSLYTGGFSDLMGSEQMEGACKKLASILNINY